MRALKYILLTVALAGVEVASAKNSVTSAIETSVAEMGSYVKLQVQAVEPAGADGQLLRLQEMWPKEVEVRADSVTTAKEIGNGLQEVTRDYILQSFDSGVYVIPPFMHISGADTALSNAITLKINPIDVSHLEDIHPMASVMSAGSKWYDFLPDWLTDNWKWLLFGIILLAAGVLTVLILTKRLKVPFLPEKKVEPPYDQAKRLMAILKEERLWEKGREKEYYSELTDILRRYIGRRFDVNAMEMTSTQLMSKLAEIPELASELKNVKAVLDTADFVKFAKMQPKPEVNLKAFDATDEIIENTRPVEAEDEATSDSKKPSEATGSEANNLITEQ